MVYFNKRPYPRTSPLFDPETDDIMKQIRSSQNVASIISFCVGLAVGAGLTLILVGLFLR